MAIYTVPLTKIIQALKLEEIHLPGPPEDVLIQSSEINRPGLFFAGFYDFFDSKRLQIIGKTESGYMDAMDKEVRLKEYEHFFSLHPCAVVLTRGIEYSEEFLEAARRHKVPVLRTQEPTSGFMSGLIGLLNVELAPRITRHGVLVEVYGEGTLLLGESGVGKSETAVELVKRGHRLIADDAVEIRKVSNTTLVGASPENIRHFIELRGIGIVNVRDIFGMGSVKITEKLDLVIQLEQWDPQKNYSRMGIEDEYISILGNEVPCLTVPVKPGRNLAVIIEVAAMNNRQKKMGYNAARELLLGMGLDVDAEEHPHRPIVSWDM